MTHVVTTEEDDYSSESFARPREVTVYIRRHELFGWITDDESDEPIPDDPTNREHFLMIDEYKNQNVLETILNSKFNIPGSGVEQLIFSMAKHDSLSDCFDCGRFVPVESRVCLKRALTCSRCLYVSYAFSRLCLRQVRSNLHRRAEAQRDLQRQVRELTNENGRLRWKLYRRSKKH